METNEFAKKIESLVALDEPLRRKLYLYVVGQEREVGRDQAARFLKIPRALAAFHLDKLVAAELLEVSFRRLGARTGPGAGRPSKLYRRASAHLDVSLPRRRHELAAQVLAQALTRVRSEASLEAVREAARELGRRLADGTRTRRGLPLHRASHALLVIGFEPRKNKEGEVVLGNCPFDASRSDCRELICGMNLALIEGLLAGLDLREVQARLAPRPGLCCVALRDRGPTT